MCGIAGLLQFDGMLDARSTLESMDDMMAHRGPDDRGIKEFGIAGLVHRRLSIIDLSPAGHCPMPNEDETLWIVYNGEVYNYRELMPDLIARGHQFRSVCDTEVVLHAYEEYGEECVTKFNGMFAFAIYDTRKRRLFCARDRSGVKPLYYSQGPRRFAFASEPKSLLVVPWVRRRPDDGVVFDYLFHGVVDHTDRTFFADIRALPAAHTATIDESGMRIKRYWSLPSPDFAALAQPVTERLAERWAEEYGNLLSDSLKLRLRSDVTVGSCLSGGLDSSMIVCLANGLLFPETGPELHEQWHHRGERQKTFSACFDDAAIDERRYMAAVTEQTGAAAHYTFPQGDDLFEVLQSVVWHQDEPFLSTGIVAQWHVMQLARANGVKVLLDGQGADEVLCGYSGYYGPFFADLMRAGRVADLTRELSLYNRYHKAKWGSGERALTQALMARHAWLRPRLRSRFDSARGLPSWIAPGLAEDQEGSPRPVPPGFQEGVAGYLPAVAHRLFSATSLPALLRYEDRNSMAFGVEARVPYLDYRLIEYVFRAPNAMRFGNGLNKRVLRQASKGVIPDIVRHRRDKLGYTTPEAQWLRGPASHEIRRLLQSPSAAAHGYIQSDVVREQFELFAAGGPIPSAVVWRWVNLELWLRQFVDQPLLGKPPSSPLPITAAPTNA
ncbi:MAG: hypothetical protein JWO42_1218 [Chloroflexi bacterium]|jgi:asparagine synthase (glutamine-hydrolysing)|nr:hypothetical protein [Chloroflexota bacterium]